MEPPFISQKNARLTERESLNNVRWREQFRRNGFAGRYKVQGLGFPVGYEVQGSRFKAYGLQPGNFSSFAGAQSRVYRVQYTDDTIHPKAQASYSKSHNHLTASGNSRLI